MKLFALIICLLLSSCTPPSPPPQEAKGETFEFGVMCGAIAYHSLLQEGVIGADGNLRNPNAGDSSFSISRVTTEEVIMKRAYEIMAKIEKEGN